MKMVVCYYWRMERMFHMLSQPPDLSFLPSGTAAGFSPLSPRPLRGHEQKGKAGKEKPSAMYPQVLL